SLPKQQGWFGDLPRDGEVFTFQGSSLRDLRGVFALAQRGLLQSPIETFAFERIEEAYARLVEGSLSGRAVVTMPGRG
ncbi:hypothetical protein, partial [Leucobacter sp. M11]|uniref:hypothetical protein n=1 Tax=Leucobacter sp. M11 TaxID=2993565 RepID=UPI002D9A5A2B|nr:hypothetical protein [Leucobacter sp. M11]